MAVLDKIEVGKRVEELEKLLNMNTRQFALSLNKAADPSYLGKVEKGEKSLSAKYVEWICKAHKVDRNWLLLGTGVPFINGTNVPREKSNALQLQNNTSQIDPRYIALLEERVADLKKDKEWLQRNFETNLTGLNFGQKSVLAHLAVILDKDDERDAGGNKTKSEKLKAETGRRIDDILKGGDEQGIPVGGI